MGNIFLGGIFPCENYLNESFPGGNQPLIYLVGK